MARESIAFPWTCIIHALKRWCLLHIMCCTSLFLIYVSTLKFLAAYCPELLVYCCLLMQVGIGFRIRLQYSACIFSFVTQCMFSVRSLFFISVPAGWHQDGSVHPAVWLAQVGCCLSIQSSRAKARSFSTVSTSKTTLNCKSSMWQHTASLILTAHMKHFMCPMFIYLTYRHCDVGHHAVIPATSFVKF
jgi:hypothetical protein